MFERRLLESLADWLDISLRQENPVEDVVGTVRAELETCNATVAQVSAMLSRVQTFARDGKPTSSGRFILRLSDADLAHLVEKTNYFGMLDRIFRL